MNAVKSILFISYLGVIFEINTGFADAIYKTTDDTGAVTYSQELPAASISASTEAVEIAPGPSVATMQQAQQDAQRAVQRADRLVQNRQAYNQKIFKEQEKTRRQAHKRATHQQKYQIHQGSGYSSFYPRSRPPYRNGGGPHYQPSTPTPHPTPSAGLVMPR